MSGPFNTPRGEKSTWDAVIAGEYKIPENFEPGVVVDIGANIGAFSVFCANRWPFAKIHAFEPNPALRNILIYNCRNISKFIYWPFAISPVTDERIEFYPGRGSSCYGSLIPGEHTEQNPVLVDVLSPSRLPEADLVKVDTEGAESVIIPALLASQHPKCITFEYHSTEDKEFLNRLLGGIDYICFADDEIVSGRGIMTFMKGNHD
jgi:FkbM family methyltransferase